VIDRFSLVVRSFFFSLAFGWPDGNELCGNCFVKGPLLFLRVRCNLGLGFFLGLAKQLFRIEIFCWRGRRKAGRYRDWYVAHPGSMTMMTVKLHYDKYQTNQFGRYIDGGVHKKWIPKQPEPRRQKKKKKRNAPFPRLPLPICMDYIPIFPLTNYMRKVSQHFILHPLPDRHIKPHA